MKGNTMEPWEQHIHVLQAMHREGTTFYDIDAEIYNCIMHLPVYLLDTFGLGRNSDKQEIELVHNQMVLTKTDTGYTIRHQEGEVGVKPTDHNRDWIIDQLVGGLSKLTLADRAKPTINELQDILSKYTAELSSPFGTRTNSYTWKLNAEYAPRVTQALHRAHRSITDAGIIRFHERSETEVRVSAGPYELWANISGLAIEVIDSVLDDHRPVRLDDFIKYTIERLGEAK